LRAELVSSCEMRTEAAMRYLLGLIGLALLAWGLSEADCPALRDCETDVECEDAWTECYGKAPEFEALDAEVE